MNNKQNNRIIYVATDKFDDIDFKFNLYENINIPNNVNKNEYYDTVH